MPKIIDSTDDPMEIAINEAKASADIGEVPVGAVIVNENGKIISRSGNLIETFQDPTAHAEILTIRAAAMTLGTWRLTNCDIYVTLEPCAMCASAIQHARIRRIYFGCEDYKGGAINNGVKLFNQGNCNHIPEIYDGIQSKKSKLLLKNFFATLRKK